MNVKIVSDFGENSFSMSSENAMEIIRHAMDFHTRYSRLNEKSNELFSAEENEGNCCGDSLNEPVTDAGGRSGNKDEESINETMNALKTECTDPGSKEKKSRNDALFGTDWRKEVRGKTIDEEQSDYGKYMEGYKGFLYIKCPHCGKVKGFCSKEELKEYQCKECGETLRLEGLKPMFVHCECGKGFKYYTNMDEEQFEYTCINCGAPVDMKINGRKNAFVTFGHTSVAGGGIANRGIARGIKTYARRF